MSKLNADGTPRKKYVSKKMKLARNRKNGQKKAWETRRALYPETNGYKPAMVQEVEIAEAKNPAGQGIGQVAETRKQTILDLEKKLDGADAVNRHLKALIENDNAEYRKAIAELEKTLKNKEKTPSKLLSSEAHRLRDREIELEEIITALKHDLELAKKAIDQAEKQSQTMTDRCKVAIFEREEAQEQVKALNQHNSLLTGELRGANYCFSKLAEEMSKGKEVA